MCWVDTPKGEFDSTEAVKAVDAAMLKLFPAPRPCQRCDILPDFVSEPLNGRGYMKCFQCGDTERGTHANEQEAINAWNRAGGTA